MEPHDYPSLEESIQFKYSILESLKPIMLKLPSELPNRFISAKKKEISSYF